MENEGHVTFECVLRRCGKRPPYWRTICLGGRRTMHIRGMMLDGRSSVQVPPCDVVICGGNLGEQRGKEAQKILRIITVDVDFGNVHVCSREGHAVLGWCQM